jgi:hypothetical protein
MDPQSAMPRSAKDLVNGYRDKPRVRLAMDGIHHLAGHVRIAAMLRPPPPRETRRRSAPALRGRVAEGDLAALLGLDVAHLRSLLAGAKGSTRGRERWYRWRDVEPRLTKAEVARARAKARRLRATAHGSKYWVAGYPQLVREWHPTKNGHLVPDEVTYGSGLSIWWQCPSGHVWQAKVTSRTARGDGCPYCANLRVCRDNCLATRRPDLAAQWHRRKNGALTPGDVVPGTTRRVWWQCPEGRDHQWQTSVVNRDRGTGCPFCAGLRVSATNCLSKCAPRVAREWHPTRNLPLTPRLIVAGAHQKVWWRCALGHEWRASPAMRTQSSGGTNCPYCAGHLPSDGYSFAAVHPEIARQWHPVKNGTLGPADVTPGSRRIVWWTCGEGRDHQWRAPVRHRARGTGCPYCSGSQVARKSSLAARHRRVAAEWHPRRNGGLLPDAVAAASSRKVWWRCAKGHAWRASVHSRTARGYGCPYCSGAFLTAERSLAARRRAVAGEWHPSKNGALGPHDVSAFSRRKVWWVCRRAEDHVWQAKISDRARGTGCPFCAHQRVTADASLAVARPEVAALWHETRNRPLDPRSVVPGSGRRVWWRCRAGHEWQRRVVVQVQCKHPCPECARLAGPSARVDVRRVRAMRHEGLKMPEIAVRLNVSESTLKRALRA